MKWLLGLILKAAIGTAVGRAVSHQLNSRSAKPIRPTDDGPHLRDHGHRKVTLWEYVKK